jgi:hypothetical protein
MGNSGRARGVFLDQKPAQLKMKVGNKSRTHVGGGAVHTPPTFARRTATFLRELRRCQSARSGQVLLVVWKSQATGKPPSPQSTRSKRMPVTIVFRLVPYDPCDRGDGPRVLIRDASMVGLIRSNSAAPPGPDTLPAVRRRAPRGCCLPPAVAPRHPPAGRGWSRRSAARQHALSAPCRRAPAPPPGAPGAALPGVPRGSRPPRRGTTSRRWPSSNRPARSRSAPVKAPRAWPKNSLSYSSRGTAAQFTLIIYALQTESVGRLLQCSSIQRLAIRRTDPHWLLDKGTDFVFDTDRCSRTRNSLMSVEQARCGQEQLDCFTKSSHDQLKQRCH